MSQIITPQPEPAGTLSSRVYPAASQSARISLVLAAIFFAILILLHLVKPEIDPSWRFISEYAIGKFGWLMSLAFVLLAASYIFLFLALRNLLPGKLTSRLGLGLLLLSAAGLLLAGFFTTDPVTTATGAQSAEGKMHNLGGSLGLAMPLASLFICFALLKGNSPRYEKQPVFWATVLALLGFFIAISSLSYMMMQSGGKFGPEVKVGWPNRLEILGYGAWLMVVARHVKHLPRQFE